MDNNGINSTTSASEVSDTEEKKELNNESPLDQGSLWSRDPSFSFSTRLSPKTMSMLKSISDEAFSAHTPL
jgi:hypothetical protein